MTDEQSRCVEIIRAALYSGQISAKKVDAQRALLTLVDSLNKPIGRGVDALLPPVAVYRCKRLKPFDKEIVDGCGAQYTLEQLGGSSKCACGGFFRKVEP